MNNKITQIRDEINKLDELLVYFIFKRIELVKTIGILKKQYNMPLYVPERETFIINRSIYYAKKLNISTKFIEFIFKNIITESKAIEEKIYIT